MPFTQKNRLISLSTPLGEDTLLLRKFSGSESISRLFTYHLDLLSEKSSIAFDDIVGQKVTISLIQADGSKRYFNACISRFSQSGASARFTHYQAEAVPWL